MGFVSKVTAGGATHLVGSSLYGTCSTAAGTSAKVATLADFDQLVIGVTVHIKFTYSNTASNATLKVGSTDAKDLCRHGTTRVGTTEASSWKAGAIVSFTYDGTSWVMNDYIEDKNDDTKNTAGSTDSSSKLFIVGATSQAANPQTYSQDTAYVGTDGHLYSNSKQAVNLSDSQALTNKTYNGYSLAAACAKAVDTSISVGSTSTALPTSAAVAAYVDSQMGDVAGALVYKGTVSAGSELLNVALKKGWYYIVDTAGTYGTETCEAGDMIIVNETGTYTTAALLAAAVDVIQTNIVAITNAEIDTIVAT